MSYLKRAELVIFLIIIVGAVSFFAIHFELILGIGNNEVFFRGNAARTGSFFSRGPETLPKKIWKFQTDGPIFSSPAVAEGMVYFGSTDGRFFAVDPGFFELGRSFAAANEGEHNARGGGLSDEDVQWRFDSGKEILSSPAVYGDMVYFGGEDGTLYALNKDTGKEIWTFETNGMVLSSPVVYDEMVFFGGMDHYLYAVDRMSGVKLWKFKAGSMIFSSPAVSGDMVYFGSMDHHIYALSRSGGEKIWKFPTGSMILSSPAVADDDVFFGSMDHYIYALDRKNGRLRWRMETEGPVSSSPSVSEDAVFIGGEDGAFYSLNRENGSPKWVFDTETSSQPLLPYPNKKELFQERAYPHSRF